MFALLDQIDLPAPDYNVEDNLKKFELSIPFQRILFHNFLEKVENAHKESEEKGFLTIESL